MTKKGRKPQSPRRRDHDQQPQGRTIVAGFNIPIPTELLLLPTVDASGLRAIEEKVHRMQGELARLRRDAQGSESGMAMAPEITATLLTVATNAWRAKSKMVDAETGEPREDMRRVYRHIEGIFNAFEEIGLRTIDPTGKPYDSGMALKVISFEQTPGLSREEIKETIKPSIIWQGRLLQTGEVIVGTPVLTDTTEKETSDEQKHD
jgi:molecular chaperone GrpE (heat shock protein)